MAAELGVGFDPAGSSGVAVRRVGGGGDAGVRAGERRRGEGEGDYAGSFAEKSLFFS